MPAAALVTQSAPAPAATPDGCWFSSTCSTTSPLPRSTTSTRFSAESTGGGRVARTIPYTPAAESRTRTSAAAMRSFPLGLRRVRGVVMAAWNAASRPASTASGSTRTTGTGSARPLELHAPAVDKGGPSTWRARWVTSRLASTSPGAAAEHSRAARFSAPPR